MCLSLSGPNLVATERSRQEYCSKFEKRSNQGWQGWRGQGEKKKKKQLCDDIKEKAFSFQLEDLRGHFNFDVSLFIT